MPNTSPSSSRVSLNPGNGRIHCTRTSLSTLAYRYPLKLISPHSSLCYILSYGGGIVGGDSIEISVKVDKDATLTFLTQGTTKVFKPKASGLISKQIIYAEVNGTLLLLPDPIQPFKDSSYIQIQRFEVYGRMVLLDWVISGRYEEDWLLSSYISNNEIYKDGNLIIRDVLRLDSSVRESMGSFRCFANVIIFGFPEMEARCLQSYVNEKKVRKGTTLDKIWSVNQVRGCTVIKAAGKDTEMVKSILRRLLDELQLIGGRDCLRPLE
ncbi:putative urease accessory protein [Neolecta irregularis DAH-3]|uniref:Putative urease accessory protein n=1 Tax=Neolecta irregularis (strain DAH-3) TaxID=1198029 RepID=A0A1U7LN99_NEOID|nr:putative urease accessory protein [Neolecta irregularis DAH-3]|eukprot:OLL24063.1 putative urease accessory protein [Neolecta irregularis DAH-3]